MTVGRCASSAGWSATAFARPKSSTFALTSLDVTPLGALQDDVRRLQIAMDDPFLMRGVERVGDLPRDRDRLGDRQWPTRQTIGERRSFDELENQRRDAIGFFQPVNRADVGMIERGHESRFTSET